MVKKGKPYQVVLNSALNASSSASFVGTINATTLTVTSMVSGTIAVGQYLQGGLLLGVTGSYVYISALIASTGGTGGIGTYTVSAAATNATSANYIGYVGDAKVASLKYVIDWDAIFSRDDPNRTKSYLLSFSFTTKASANITGDHNIAVLCSLGSTNTYSPSSLGSTDICQASPSGFLGIARPYNNSSSVGNYVTCYNVDNAPTYLSSYPTNKTFQVNLSSIDTVTAVSLTVTNVIPFPQYLLSLCFEEIIV